MTDPKMPDSLEGLLKWADQVAQQAQAQSDFDRLRDEIGECMTQAAEHTDAIATGMQKHADPETISALALSSIAFSLRARNLIAVADAAERSAIIARRERAVDASLKRFEDALKTPAQIEENETNG